MNKHDLRNKRIIPCFNEIYREAVCCIDLGGRVPDWDWVRDHTPCVINRGEPRLQHLFPYDCFYLPDARMREIIQKHTKGLRGSWYYPYKFGNLSNPNWESEDEKHHKILLDFREFELATEKDKSLTSYQRRRKIEDRALKDGFQRRNWDAESVSASITLGPSPSGVKDKMQDMRNVYELISPYVKKHVEAGVFISWKKQPEAAAELAKARPDDWVLTRLQTQEAESFATLLDKVEEDCFGLIHEKLNMDKWGIRYKVEQCTALWLMANVL